MRSRLTSRWVVLVVGVALALSACSGAEDQSSSAGDEASGAAEASASAALRAELNRGPAAGSQLEGREIVYTGSMTLRVDDAEATSAEAARIAGEAGGFVSAQDAELQGVQEITTTVRVPADRFTEVADEISELGTVVARQVDSDDVTDQVVDLEGRLENARASADRLRELLAEANDVNHVVAIEDRLAQREADIELIAGELEVLEDQVALATLEVTLTERASPTVNDDLPGPVEALRAGAVALVNVLLVLLAVVAFLLPFTPFAVGGWWLWRRHRRRREVRRAAQRAELPPPPQWPAAAPAGADTPLGDQPSEP